MRYSIEKLAKNHNHATFFISHVALIIMRIIRSFTSTIKFDFIDYNEN